MKTHKCGGCGKPAPLMPVQQFDTASTSVQGAWLAAVEAYGLQETWCVPCIARQDWGHVRKYGKSIARCNKWLDHLAVGHNTDGTHRF